MGPEPPEGLRGPVRVVGRINTASNATFLGSVGDVAVVYKPRVGEQPLWDFPDGTLADREVAAHLLSVASGWGIVPRTWLGTGPFGEGMVQQWCDIDPDQDPVDVVAEDAVPIAGRRTVLTTYDEQDRPVALVHEDSAALRRMALFDVVANNADRKGAHVLAMPSGHRYGVDHGLTFLSEHRLRTVLWGWIGEPLRADEIAGVRRMRAAVESSQAGSIAELLTEEECSACVVRCDGLMAAGVFPAPSGSMPAVPWPLF